MFYGSGQINQQLRGHTNPIWFLASTSGDVQQPKNLVSGDSTPSSGHHGHGYNEHTSTYIKFLIKNHIL